MITGRREKLRQGGKGQREEDEMKKTCSCSVFEIGCRRCCLSWGIRCAISLFFICFAFSRRFTLYFRSLVCLVRASKPANSIWSRRIRIVYDGGWILLKYFSFTSLIFRSRKRTFNVLEKSSLVLILPRSFRRYRVFLTLKSISSLSKIWKNYSWYTCTWVFVSIFCPVYSRNK